ncbi:monofunctional biosynthetic peptidoglycan transglycosylase [hydrocarbon metagenome]|uniref:Monofunctional biosynthetic peptidoglycan transglycosylase n=1 Tax=hydrocarbon metagenome TaxID=938273 RepID=A0A0W8FP04_9ZZZZ
MKFVKGLYMRIPKKFISITLILILAYFVADVGRYFVYPSISDLKKNRPDKTAFMKYREKIWREKGIKKRITNIWVPLSSISPYLMKAVIIAEDDKFWSHEGFDFEAMQKALEKDIKKKKFKAGGSTISQQLAKNLYLSPSKNPIRKLKEAILTWRLERNLSKRRIMELYLNVAEWGDGIYGIEVAARKHFGKSASALTAREAATLAAVIPSPRRYRTDGTSRYVGNQSERIYQIMVRRGIVIPEYDEVISKEAETNQETAGLEQSQGQQQDNVQEEQSMNPVLPEAENKINP